MPNTKSNWHVMYSGPKDKFPQQQDSIKENVGDLQESFALLQVFNNILQKHRSEELSAAEETLSEDESKIALQKLPKVVVKSEKSLDQEKEVYYIQNSENEGKLPDEQYQDFEFNLTNLQLRKNPQSASMNIVAQIWGAMQGASNTNNYKIAVKMEKTLFQTMQATYREILQNDDFFQETGNEKLDAEIKKGDFSGGFLSVLRQENEENNNLGALSMVILGEEKVGVLLAKNEGVMSSARRIEICKPIMRCVCAVHFKNIFAEWFPKVAKKIQKEITDQRTSVEEVTKALQDTSSAEQQAIQNIDGASI